MDIYFASSNQSKRKEALEFLSSDSITICPVDIKIEEIQSVNMEEIAEDKVIRAFQRVWRPVLVEQTGLLLNAFGGLPGGFTEILWETLGAKQFGSFFSSLESQEAVAKSVLAFCDGRNVRVFSGETQGHIISKPLGNRDYGWGSVFLPSGCTKTLAEMREEGTDGAFMRKKVLEQVKAYLEEMEHETVSQ